MTTLERRIAGWKPEGITLEPAALRAATNQDNTLVVAGPGAGKTELLAQRACFLLQTGVCQPPYRILAISFKREAAENLRARVILRCGRELAARFDSMTYDAFAKDVLDRFRLSLPSAFRSSADYQIITGRDVSEERFRDVLMSLTKQQCSLSDAQRQMISGAALVWTGILGQALPPDNWPRDLNRVAGASVWLAMIADRPSRLSFPMISRLAEYVIRGNQGIQKALRDTYRFVFLDEFQDTTGIQFALTEACFLGSAAVLTAVGDSKQRIMGWAGALHGIFKRFQDSFGAKVEPLTQNHRSRSRLVAIQSVFARELDPEAAEATTSRTGDETGECRVLEFEDENHEARTLAEFIDYAINTEKVPADEICVLCRARPDSFAQALCDALRTRQVKVRVEVDRRETLGEPVAALLLDIITLIFADAAPEAWENVSATLSELEGDQNEQETVRTMSCLLGFLSAQKAKMPLATADKDAVRKALDECLDFVGRDRFSSVHPQYAQGDYMETVLDRLAALIESELSETGWNSVVDAIKGAGAVSVMTMHKSKGLEFHTVIFLGLEDRAIWNYDKNAEEETCGLFVALSRAKERCVLTFCRSRPGRYGTPVVQTRITINRIFELFEESGVTVETIA